MQNQLGHGRVWQAHTFIRRSSRNPETNQPASGAAGVTPHCGQSGSKPFPLCTKGQSLFPLTSESHQGNPTAGDKQPQVCSSPCLDSLLFSEHSLFQTNCMQWGGLERRNPGGEFLPFLLLVLQWPHRESPHTTLHHPHPRPCCDSNKGKRSVLILPGPRNVLTGSSTSCT